VSLGTFKRFEEMDVWKKSREFIKIIYALTLKKEFARDFSLRDQIRRASVSVLSNISEGYERESKKEFLRFLLIAKGSIGEVRSQLYIALDLNYLTQEEFNSSLEKSKEISYMLKSLIKYLRDNLNEKKPD
jgi:four helix bundle protein